MRGASTTEYAIVLTFALILLPPLYQRYGDVLQQHMARAAEKFAENYYYGWFWPHDDVAGNGTPSTPRAGRGGGSSGGPSESAPSEPGSAGGGSPLGGGNAAVRVPGAPSFRR